MKDEELADEVIARLNKLIEDPAVRKDIGTLLERRIPLGELSTKTREHPTIQTPMGLGAFGLLNGLVGVITSGPRQGWGYISAEFSDDNQLVRFLRTGIGYCKRCGESDPTRINGRCAGVKGSSHDWVAPSA
jgi:hypothetical protein